MNVKNTSRTPVALKDGRHLPPGEFGDTDDDDPVIEQGLVTPANDTPAEAPAEVEPPYASVKRTPVVEFTTVKPHAGLLRQASRTIRRI